MAALTEIDEQFNTRVASENRVTFVATKVRENGMPETLSLKVVMPRRRARDYHNFRYPSVTTCSTLGSYLANKL